MFAFAGLVALLTGAAIVRADPVPTAPGPGDVFKEGGQCTFTWDVDTTGQWKTMNVELMSGDNWNMIHITTVATLDGTDASNTTYSYTCPQVIPNSAIYFYQFTSPNAANRTWTTRFAIADANGNTTPAPNATQPDGQSIPWGLGKLVDPSTAVAAPSYLASGTSGATGATASSTGSAAATSAGATSGATSGAGTIPPASQSVSGASASPSSGAASSVPPSGATTNTTGTSNTNSTGGAGSANGAMSALAVDGYLFGAVGTLSAAAFAFAIVL
ncbi:hypothetical protein BD414DRAFT_478234 [Trametes punicea]|nr:hypothetical protein BD414DRAFT_478234 [Trametes punicea]